jgi:ACS family sodium-dependent inorganic phosphate cotransporter
MITAKTHLMPSKITDLQIPGGWAAQIYGGRMMLIISFALWSLVSIFTPTSAKSIPAILVARVCVGVAQGFLIPSVHTVLSQVGSE